MEPQHISIAINVLLALIAFFGGSMVRDLSSAVKELRIADKELYDRISSLGREAITHDEIKEIRGEIRDGFNRVHERIDEMANKYVTKEECRRCWDK